ncbi:MAG TPA: hypothetical protein DCM28_16375, partial [Phycisphaerales bacterium]|nr:hypothetical protein [Phycisphaerales bacterium]
LTSIIERDTLAVLGLSDKINLPVSETMRLATSANELLDETPVLAKVTRSNMPKSALVNPPEVAPDKQSGAAGN